MGYCMGKRVRRVGGWVGERRYLGSSEAGLVASVGLSIQASDVFELRVSH